MNKNREILRKLMEELKRKTVFPAYIGSEPKVLRCNLMGSNMRVSGFLGANFPPEVLEITEADQNEVRDAFEWVTGGSPELYAEMDGTFFAFIPMDEAKWPQD